MTDKPNNSLLKKDVSPKNKGRKISWGEVKISEYFKAHQESPEVNSPGQRMKYLSNNSTHKTVDQFEKEKQIKQNELNNNNVSFSEIDSFHINPPAPTHTNPEALELFNAMNSEPITEIMQEAPDNNEPGTPQFSATENDEMEIDQKHSKARKVKFGQGYESSPKEETDEPPKPILRNKDEKPLIKRQDHESTPKNNNSKLSSSISPADKPQFVHEFRSKRNINLQEHFNSQVEPHKLSINTLMAELCSENPNEISIGDHLRGGNINLKDLPSACLRKIALTRDLFQINRDISCEECKKLNENEVSSCQISLTDLKGKLFDYLYGRMKQNGSKAKYAIKDALTINTFNNEISKQIGVIQKKLNETAAEKIVSIDECNESLAAKLSSSDNVGIAVQELSAILYISGWKIKDLESCITGKVLSVYSIPFGIMLKLQYQNNVNMNLIKGGNRY
jgi:hypothetical protein